MFIVLEGPDASSKSTQAGLLKNFFVNRGETVTVLKEPGSTELGEQLRSLLLNGKMDSRSELALFFASRSDNVTKNILIKKNIEVVICDRYTDSTIAYQCHGNQTISENEIKHMLEFFSYGVKPDITFVLDVTYDVAMKRMWNRTKNHYDASGEDYFNRVRYYYKSLKDKEKYVYIDTSDLSIDEVQKEIQKHL
jgi:dTMP kinase